MSTASLTRRVADRAADQAPWVAGVYLRISDDREGLECGVERQLEDCTALADSMNARIYNIYKDNDIGASTRSAPKPRKGYMRLLADARAGHVNVIIAYTTGRLTRRPMEHEGQIEIAEQCGTRFTFVRSPEFDLNTAQGRMIARILSNIDAGEAETIAERVARAALQRAEEGRFGGGVRPFGFGMLNVKTIRGIDTPYMDCNQVRESEAKEIVKATKAVLAGKSLLSIVKDLTARGVPTVTGSEWTVRSLKQILMRPRNIGVSIYKGEEVGKAAWDPIIENEEDFRAVCHILSDDRRRTSPGNKPKWLGSCLWLCTCGNTMIVKHNDTGRPIYTCRKPGGGGHVARRVDDLDAFVVEVVLERLSRPDLVEATRKPETVNVDVPALRVEAARLRDRLTDLAEAYAEGEISRVQMRIASERLTAKLNETENRLSLAVTSSPLAPILGVPDVRAAWSALSLEAKRGILKRLLTVTVLPTKGQTRKFDPSAVRITWLDQTEEMETAA